MKNYVQKGDSLTVTLAADVAGGDVVVLGALIGVAAGSYLSGQDGVICTEGVFNLGKDASVFATGDAVYFDAAENKVTSTATDNTLIGAAVAPALTGDLTVKVLLG